MWRTSLYPICTTVMNFPEIEAEGFHVKIWIAQNLFLSRYARCAYYSNKKRCDKISCAAEILNYLGK